MTEKQKVLDAVQALPDTATISDVMDELLLLAKIELGLEQAEAGLTISQEEMELRLANLCSPNLASPHT